MARGIQPTPQQLEEERRITELAATDALLTWDRYETELLTHLSRQLGDNPKARAIAERLSRGNRIEDADHVELHAAVRGGLAS